MEEPCAGSSRKEEGAETIPMKREKRGDGRNVCRNRNCVQGSSRERRLQEMCAGNSKKVGAGEGRKCVQEQEMCALNSKRRLQELCAGSSKNEEGAETNPGNFKREEMAGTVCKDQ